jgi:hypothetical protein
MPRGSGVRRRPYSDRYDRDDRAPACAHDECWSLRSSPLDSWRKPLAAAMVLAGVVLSGHTVVDRIVSDPIRRTAGAAVPNDHLTFKPAAMPNVGTAVATGYYAAPPYAPVDPVPPRPALRLDLP